MLGVRRPVTRERCDVAIVGSGFSGSLMARVLAVLGYDVVLLERGAHPRFAISESTTPLANLSLERLGRRYGLAGCYGLAAPGGGLGAARGARARVHVLPAPSGRVVRRPRFGLRAVTRRGEPSRCCIGHALAARRC